MSRMKEALERAIGARSQSPREIFRDDQGVKTWPNRRIKSERQRRDVHVEYTRTKVEPIDPKILKRNKVFALFPDNEITDRINLLRAQVLNKLEEIGGNSLLVTSALPGEGKTFTSINLGVSLAQELDRTVLLVDADLRNPSFHHYDFANDFFGIDVNRGLSDYLLGQLDLPDILLNPGIQRLTIQPGGKPMPNSAELLRSVRMEGLIAEMKNRYPADRIIIFDSPSLLCADPLVLSKFIDGILLVVEQERTTADDLRRAMNILKGKCIIGTVLNKANSGDLTNV